MNPKEIYICEKTGSIYWLDEGVLMYAPMSKGDSQIDLEADGGEVDLDFLRDNASDIYKIVYAVYKKLNQ